RTLRRGALPAAAATTTAIVESTAAAFATTASTFTTAIATTAAAATATESATATRAGAIFGFVHADRTAIERSSVHFTGGHLSVVGGAHRHESESTRATRFAIGHHLGLEHFTKTAKGAAETLIVGVPAE